MEGDEGDTTDSAAAGKPDIFSGKSSFIDLAVLLPGFLSLSSSNANKSASSICGSSDTVGTNRGDISEAIASVLFPSGCAVSDDTDPALATALLIFNIDEVGADVDSSGALVAVDFGTSFAGEPSCAAVAVAIADLFASIEKAVTGAWLRFPFLLYRDGAARAFCTY